jgi:mannose-6-phosphate isomerase-like protein (cupin superfamily)
MNTTEASIRVRKKSEYLCEQCGCSFLRRTDTAKTSQLCHNQVLCNLCIHKKKYLVNENFKKSHTEAIKTASAARRNKDELNKLTISCNCCSENFEVPYGQRGQLYCSRSCQSKSIVRPESIKQLSECQECHKNFSHYGSQKFCSNECNSIYMSKIRIGENNPNWTPRESCVCLGCQKMFSYSRNGMSPGSIRKFCSLECWRGNQSSNEGQTAPILYPKEFKKAAQDCREKFNNLCFICGKTKDDNGENMSVHHIDYDKNNCCDKNLVPLCRRCHSFTNSKDRHFWRTLFAVTLSSSTLVKKTWGLEVHIANHSDYCLKYLIFFKDQYFSNHYHTIKKEAWHCLVGEFEVILTDIDDTQEYMVLEEGGKLEVDRKVVHQIYARKNSILTEVSTQSFIEDSHKDYPSLLDCKNP